MGWPLYDDVVKLARKAAPAQRCSSSDLCLRHGDKRHHDGQRMQQDPLNSEGGGVFRQAGTFGRRFHRTARLLHVVCFSGTLSDGYLNLGARGRLQLGSRRFQLGARPFLPGTGSRSRKGEPLMQAEQNQIKNRCGFLPAVWAEGSASGTDPERRRLLDV